MLRSETLSVVPVMAHLSKADRQRATANVATISSHVFLRRCQKLEMTHNHRQKRTPRVSQLRGTIRLRRPKCLRSLGQSRVRRVTGLVLLWDQVSARPYLRVGHLPYIWFAAAALILSVPRHKLCQRQRTETVREHTYEHGEQRSPGQIRCFFELKGDFVFATFEI
jgi:hypothetical protein